MTEKYRFRQLSGWGQLKDISVLPAMLDVMQILPFPQKFDQVLRKVTGTKNIQQLATLGGMVWPAGV